MQQAADQGFAWAQYNLGLMYDQDYGVPKDERKAVELYQKAADQGLAWAQCNLGIVYWGGGESIMRDKQKACTLWKLAGEKGDSRSIKQYNQLCDK
ncbi:MAG: hypothetical protein LBC94_07910 [Desulfovibrio sp.]|nr:hypothetical protein [Desulfovibrio sp.]